MKFFNKDVTFRHPAPWPRLSLLLRDLVAFINRQVRVGVWLKLSANQGVSASTWTFISWSTEVQDDRGWHSNTTNKERITVDQEGWYTVTCTVIWDTVGGSRIILRMMKNGATATASSTYDFARNEYPSSVSTDGAMQVSGQVYLDPDDYVTVAVWQDIGSVNMESGDGKTQLQMTT